MKPTAKLALVAMLAAITALSFGQTITWQKKLPDALKIAKKLKKPVMIDFYGDY